MLALALIFATLTSLPLPFVQNTWQLTAVRMIFGFFAVVIQPAVVRLIRGRAPHGMEARALPFGIAFQMLGNGGAPMLAGLVSPLIGLRGFFVINSLALLSGFLLWTACLMKASAGDALRGK